MPAAQYRNYDHHGRTVEYHRAQVRQSFSFRQATVEDAEGLAEWLLEQVTSREYDAERLMEAAYARLRILKVGAAHTREDRASSALSPEKLRWALL